MVVPTYNERERIAELVDALFGTCATQNLRLELVIVDDNSPDGTARWRTTLRSSTASVSFTVPASSGWGRPSLPGSPLRRQTSSG